MRQASTAEAAGSADITPAIESSGYQTATLTHGTSVTLTVVISYPTVAPANCYSDQFYVESATSSAISETNLLPNLQAS